MYTKLLLSLIASATITFLFSTCTSNSPVRTRREVNSPTFDYNYARAYDLLIKAADNFNKAESVDSGKLAIPIIEKLAAQTDDSLVWATYAEILFEVGYAYQMNDMYDSCYPYLKKSLHVCLEHFGEDYLLTTMCLNKLSFYYYFIGDLAKEREYLFRSFRMRRKICDSVDIYLAYGYGNMGAYYYEIGDIAKGSLFRQKARNIISYQYQMYSQTQNPLTNDSMKRVTHYINRFPKWKNTFLTNIPRAHAWNVLDASWHYLDKDNFVAYLNKVEEYKQVIKKDSVARIYTKLSYFGNQSEYFRRIGNSQQSSAYLDSINQHLDLVTGKKYSQEAIKTKIYTLIRRGNLEAAKNVLDSWQISQNEDKRFLLAKYFLLSAELDGQTNSEKAISFCDSSYQLILSEENYKKLLTRNLSWDNLKPNEAQQILYFLKVEIMAKMQWTQKQTISYADKLLNLFDFYHKGSIFLQERNFTTESKILSDETDYPIYEKAIRLANSLYEKTRNQDYFMKMMQWSDGIKAISLKKSILNTKILNDRNELENVSSVMELESMIERIKIRIKDEKRDSAVRKDEIIKNLDNSLVEYTAQLEELREKFSQTLQVAYNPNDRIDYPMEKIKTLLKRKKACLIDYFVGDEFINASVIAPDTFVSRCIPYGPEQKKLLSDFVENIRKPGGSSLTQTPDKEGYHMLLSPFKDVIAGKSLIIIPDGILYRFPFELLRDDQGRLIDHHSIQYEYSAQMLIKEAFSTADFSYTGFAPEYASNDKVNVTGEEAVMLEEIYNSARAMLGPLKFNIPEVIESAQLFNGRSFIGTKVDKQTFLNNSKDSRILHLAMHAITDDQNPDYSQLFFKHDSTQQPLYAYELNEQHLKSELAILSACNTGVGLYRRGDGVQSLARAFKAAGCKNIVMSLWPANDASTKDIVVGFLKKLKAGMGKADALRQSKLDYLQTAPPELKHPYYWAGLVLIGDNEAMDFGNKFLTKGILITILLLSIIIISIVMIRRKGHFG
ncbi:MAG: CHAT domain-containing protein [Saprospiraceae bacterium]|nr:CHAT domain-containing protein [Saprospiraceae bacterium]